MSDHVRNNRVDELLAIVSNPAYEPPSGTWHRCVNKFVSVINLARRGLMYGLHLAQSLLALGQKVWSIVCWPFNAIQQTVRESIAYAGDIAFCCTTVAIVTVASNFGWWSGIPMLLSTLMLALAGDSPVRKVVASIAALYSSYKMGNDLGRAYRATNVTVNTVNQFPQMGMQPLDPQSDEQWNPTALLFSSCAKAMACILSMVLVWHLPANQNFDALLRRFDAVPKALKGITSMTEAVESGLRYAFGQHFSHYFGDATILAEPIPDLIVQQAKEVVQLSLAETYVKIPSDPALCQRISTLYQDFNRYRIEYARNRTVQAYMDKYAGSMINLFMKASSHSPKANENRSKPTVAMLRGGTGVGKSQLLYFLCAALMALDGRLSPDVTDAELRDLIASCMYSRACEQEFWDAYNGQYVCLWDDFGQMVDSASKPNLEFFELIRACNTFPYPLHMASLEQKANTFFKSSYMVCTTNLQQISPVSVVDADAVRSRLHFCYDVVVKPEFRKGTGNDEISNSIDPAKVLAIAGQALSLDVYEFYRFDPVTGRRTNERVSYDELVRAMSEHHKRQMELFEESKTSLVQHTRQFMLQPQMWPFSSGEIDQINQAAYDVEDAMSAVQTAHARARALLAPYADWLAIVSGLGAFASIVYLCYQYWRSKGGEEDDLEIVPESGKSREPNIAKARVESGKSREPNIVKTKVESGKSRELNIMKAKVESGKSREPKAHVAKVEARLVRTGRRTPPPRPKYRKPTEIVPESVGDIVIYEEPDWNEEHIFHVAYDGKAYKVVHADWFEDGWAYQRQLLEAAGFIDDETFIVDCFECDAPNGGRMLAYVEDENVLGTDLFNMILSTGFISAAITLLPQAFACQQSLEVTQKIQAKAYRWLKTPTGEILAPMLCIGDRVCLINTHYWERFGNFNSFQMSTINSRAGTHVSRERLKVQPLCRKKGEETDVTIITFPNTFESGWHLWELFHDRADFHALVGKRTVLCSVMPPVDRHDYPQFHTKVGKITQKVSEPVDFNGGVICATLYHADIPSMPGDCGGVYIVDEPNVRGKIVGFHFAGANPGGMMVPLFREDFEDLMAPKPKVLDVPFVEPSADTPFDGHLTPHGITSKSVFSPTTSKFKPTPLHGKLGPVTTAPALLCPLLKKDGPGIKALQKVAGGVPEIDPNLIERAKQSFKQKVLVGDVSEHERRKLTFEEAVQGIPGEAYITGINRSRSAGWPWCLTTKQKGKTKWFGSTEWKLGETAEEVRKAVEEQELQLANNSWTPAVFVDTLKDETRTLDKIAAGKTRVFSAAPMDFVIIFRMYFLGFLAYTMRKKIHNEIAVGINALSLDWDILARHLRSKGNRMIAGDFTNYDGSLHPDVLYAVCDIINEFYDDEWQQQRRLLFENVVHSYHLAGKYVYSWSHSQPSGNPGTAVFNSMYNSLICRMVYYVLEAQHGESHAIHDTFNQNVSMISYGDDNILASQKEWFTMEAMVPIMTQFGMTYTSERKDGELYKWKGLEECAFLQRGFRREGSMWYGPLGERSINDRLNWTQDSVTPDETLRLNIDGAIAEWALHDKETFEFWSKKIGRAAVLHANYAPPVYPHKWYLDQVIWGNYSKIYGQLTWT